MKLFRLTLLFAVVLPLFGVVQPIAAQIPKSAPASAEARAAHALETAKKAGAPELYAFLRNFPKGADLHTHLGGTTYAETLIAEGGRQGLCVDPSTMSFVQPPCSKGLISAADVPKDQKFYDKLINALSMRSFVPTSGFSGHDQFFITFDRFDSISGFYGEWLDDIATRAASQNEQYLEVMETPSFGHAAGLGDKLGWPAGAEKNISVKQLSDLRTALLAQGLRDEVAVDTKEFADAKASRNSIENCSPDGKSTPSGKVGGIGCGVQIHWLYQILRGFPPQEVFAQTLLGFEVASVNSDFVGINFVMPEDGYLSMRDYHLQMQMLDYLHSVYPKVHITLHAGELAPGLVPPEGLSFHIREAIDLGHAERIGHGIDVLYETNPEALLKEMAEKHIDVEVNLTSNEGILGIKGSDHPLHAYMAAHVPFSLSTDDEGVSRIDITHEYVKAVEDQNLTYADLKSSARNSLEYSFLHGESLYTDAGNYVRRVAACAAPIRANSTPDTTCKSFLDANEKAAQQYELERRFAAFEGQALPY